MDWIVEPSERNEGQVPTCAEGSGARPELGECFVQLSASTDLVNACQAFRIFSDRFDGKIRSSTV